MARKQCQVCGQPATVRVEANLNGRHSTMLLCDDHYRQLVRQQKRTVSPLEALFGSRSGLFEDFLAATSSASVTTHRPWRPIPTRSSMPRSANPPGRVGTAPSRQWAGQPYQRTVRGPIAGGRPNTRRVPGAPVDTEHLLLR